MKFLVIDPSIQNLEDDTFALIQSLFHRFKTDKWSGIERLTPAMSNAPIPPDVGGLILLGSKANVTDDLPWIDILSCQILKLAFNQSVPTLGICFGHQLLSYLAGATVDECHTVTEVKTTRAVRCLHPRLAKMLDIQTQDLPRIFLSTALHGQEVKNLPTGFELTCTSDFCKYEGFVHVDKPILTLQTHPEYGTTDGDLIMENFMKAVCKNHSDI
jgi:GMP synthase (glutamine-hydrolysing)